MPSPGWKAFAGQTSFAGSIIPGSRNSDHPTEKFIFHLKLSLEVEGRQGQLHREIDTVGPVSKNRTLFDTKCHLT